jgi:hypothetical protein
MRNRYLFTTVILVSLTVLFFTSCSSDDSTLPQEDLGDVIEKSCSMTFNGQVTFFYLDGEEQIQTRGSASDWEDGTNIYIVFKTPSASVYGTASYDTSHGWSISYTGTLPSGQAGKCEVYYFENTPNANYSSIQFGEESIVYVDNEGSYEYNQSNNTCIVNSTLSPAVSRIRFKGNNGTKITLSGISRYTAYGALDGKFNKTNNDINLIVNNSGYTSYVYGFLDDESDREISITNGDYTYTTQCRGDVLVLGESGYMNVPTEASHSGWTVKQAMQTTGAVDLGLSVKWAACNLGANSPEEYGDYYAWGETETKADYSSSTYKYQSNYSYTNIGEDIAGTQYDVAHAILGGTWMIPTVEQIQELIEKCRIEESIYKGIKGQRIVGVNGHSIFVPISGYKDGRSIKNRDEYGYVSFWASQYETSYTGSSAYVYWGHRGEGQTNTWNRMYGLPIRPICK